MNTKNARSFFAALTVTVSTLCSASAFAAPSIQTDSKTSSTEAVPGSEKTKSEKTSVAGKSELAKNNQALVEGDWVSEWGPVLFKKDAAGVYSGQWNEGKDGKDKIGKIEHGKLDEKTSAFEFDFRETWTGLAGHAKLKLSADKKKLSGDWTREKKKGSTEKDKGTWSMTRPAK